MLKHFAKVKVSNFSQLIYGFITVSQKKAISEITVII